MVTARFGRPAWRGNSRPRFTAKSIPRRETSAQSSGWQGGELALLGVDGIVVARELDIAPQPVSEWEAVLTTDEGRVFHRRGAPFARVRSITSIDSRPREQFVTATISRINDSRNRVEADIDVPNGDRPALFTFSRPYFRGYQARLGNRKLAVTSYRGLFPDSRSSSRYTWVAYTDVSAVLAGLGRQCSDYLRARDFVESFATIGRHTSSIAAKAHN